MASWNKNLLGNQGYQFSSVNTSGSAASVGLNHRPLGRTLMSDERKTEIRLPRRQAVRSSKKSKLRLSKKRWMIYLILLAFCLLGWRFWRGYRNFRSELHGQSLGTSSSRQIQSVSTSVGKDFVFKGFDMKGKESGEIKLSILSAEKTSQVMVQDKTFASKPGKLFLILNIELTNDSTDRLNLFPGDLIRLIADKQGKKKYAPDLHNNVVLVAPISTKTDRVGFVVDEHLNEFELLVGELEGEKQKVEVKFDS